MLSLQELDIVLHVLVHLATHSADVPQPLSAIAQQCRCSEGALNRIFRRFTEAGLLDAQRGCQGGFRLSRLLERITVHEIVQALDGQTGVPFCPHSCYNGCCHLQNCLMNGACTGGNSQGRSHWRGGVDDLAD